MQQSVPQSADWAAQAQAQPYYQAQPYTLPYAQAQSQPYAQPYAQPQAQAAGWQGMPQFPGMPPQQPQPQPQPQQNPAQMAPIAPVAGAVPPQTGAGGPQQQDPRQAMNRHLVGIAKMLEQSIPGYQILISVLLDLSVSPRAQAVPGLETLIDRLKEAALIHYGTLGFIRRFMMGEANQDTLGGLAVGVNRLIHLHKETRPMWERAVSSAPQDLRHVLTGLQQAIATADNLFTQAAGAVQQVVGPQVWEIAKAKATGAPVPETAGGHL